MGRMEVRGQQKSTSPEDGRVETRGVVVSSISKPRWGSLNVTTMIRTKMRTNTNALPIVSVTHLAIH